jgi:DNA-directed RNA polymerase subunit RPC12/RpoP
MSTTRIPLIDLTAPDPGQTKYILSAPPAIRLSDQSVDYTCGRCGAALVHAEEDQVQGLVIHCTDCGTYNCSPR